MAQYSQAIKIIVNPPYNGRFHLKVVLEAMKHSDDVVNLSPIRWLQDPLAEYKKNSDFKKFENVRAHISNLEVVPTKDVNNLFGIDFSNIGIYHITPNGGFNISSLRKQSPLLKVLKKLDKTFADVATEEGWRGEYKGIFGVVSSHLGGEESHGGTNFFISDNWELFITPRYTHTNKVIFFKTEAERKNCFDYLTSSFMKKYASIIRTNQRIPWAFVPYLDFSHPWDDAALYKYFGLTQEEISLIEEEMK